MHSSSGFGAIAQLGERVLCKHEVVGSIPSGSTSLRWPSQLRFGKPIDASSRLISKAGPNDRRQYHRPRKHHFACVVLTGHDCGIYDIVKRRSIRVWDLQSNLRVPDHNLQIISALVHRKMSGL